MLRLCGSLVAALLLLVLALGGGALFLQRRAVTADFIRDRLASSLQREFGGGATVEIGHVRIGGGESYLSTQVLDLVVRGPRGELLLSAPDARIDLAPAALARFELAAQKLTLDRIDLAIDISADGVISVANLGVAEQTSGPAGEIAASILAVLNGKMGVGGAPIPIVAVENGRLQINDARRHSKFLLEGISISADPTEDGRPAIRIAGQSPGGRIVARLAPGAEPLSFTLSVDRISPADIGVLIGDDLKFVSGTLPLSLNLSARVDDAARPQEVKGEVTFGRGQFFIDDPDAKPIDIVEARAKFRYAASDAIVHLDELAINAGGLTTVLDGTLTPLGDASPGWHLQLGGESGTLRPISQEDKPVVISSVQADATLLPDARKVPSPVMTAAMSSVALSCE